MWILVFLSGWKRGDINSTRPSFFFSFSLTNPNPRVTFSAATLYQRRRPSIVSIVSGKGEKTRGKAARPRRGREKEGAVRWSPSLEGTPANSDCRIRESTAITLNRQPPSNTIVGEEKTVKHEREMVLRGDRQQQETSGDLKIAPATVNCRRGRWLGRFPDRKG